MIKPSVMVKIVSIFLALTLVGSQAYADISSISNNKLAPSSRLDSKEFKTSFAANAICELIEIKARYGKPLTEVALDDIAKWQNAADPELNGCAFNPRLEEGEVTIEIPAEGLAVRYFDPKNANVVTPFSDISKLHTKVISDRLSRQIIHRTKSLPLLASEKLIGQKKDKLKTSELANEKSMASLSYIANELLDTDIYKYIKEGMKGLRNPQNAESCGPFDPMKIMYANGAITILHDYLGQHIAIEIRRQDQNYNPGSNEILLDSQFIVRIKEDGSDEFFTELAERAIKAIKEDLEDREVQTGKIVDLQNKTKGKKIIVVSDLHGMAENLEKILADINWDTVPDEKRPILVISGDSVHISEQVLRMHKPQEDEPDYERKLETYESMFNEMSGSIAMIKRIFELKAEYPKNVYYLIGNHDNVYYFKTAKPVSQNTALQVALLKEVGSDNLDRYIEFLNLCPMLFVADSLAVCHAGPIIGKALTDLTDEAKTKNTTPLEVLKTRPLDLNKVDPPPGVARDESAFQLTSIMHRGYAPEKLTYTEPDVRNFLRTIGLGDNATLSVGHDHDFNRKEREPYHDVINDHIYSARVFDSCEHYIVFSGGLIPCYAEFDGGKPRFVPTAPPVLVDRLKTFIDKAVDNIRLTILLQNVCDSFRGPNEEGEVIIGKIYGKFIDELGDLIERTENGNYEIDASTDNIAGKALLEVVTRWPETKQKIDVTQPGPATFFKDEAQIKTLRDAADLMKEPFHKRPLKSDGKTAGQLLTLDADRLIVIGDLHTEPQALDDAIGRIDKNELISGKTKIALVGDIVSRNAPEDYEYYLKVFGNSIYKDYEDYKANAGKRSYNLLLKIAKLKCRYPDSIFVLPGNGELDFTRKRVSEEFMKLFTDSSKKILPDKERLYNSVRDFIDTMPFFAIVEVAGKKYLISHGGVVEAPSSEKLLSLGDPADMLGPLINFERHGVEKGTVDISDDFVSFRQLCYPAVSPTNGKNYPQNAGVIPQNSIEKACVRFGVDYQICGHSHLYGANQAENKALGIIIPNPQTTYGYATDKLHIVNSMALNNHYAYLEVTPGGIAVHAVIYKENSREFFRCDPVINKLRIQGMIVKKGDRLEEELKTIARKNPETFREAFVRQPQDQKDIREVLGYSDILSLENELSNSFSNVGIGDGMETYNNCLKIIYRNVPNEYFEKFVKNEGHGLIHVIKDILFALQILKADNNLTANLDLKALVTAIMFHDIAHFALRERHSVTSRYMAEGILSSEGFDAEFIRKVARIANAHHVKEMESTGDKGVYSEYIEAQIIADADTLANALDIERIYAMGSKDRFFDRGLSIEQRLDDAMKISMIDVKQKDLLVYLVECGFRRRQPEHYFTAAAKQIVSARFDKAAEEIKQLIDNDHVYALNDTEKKETKTLVDKLFVKYQEKMRVILKSASETPATSKMTFAESYTKGQIEYIDKNQALFKDMLAEGRQDVLLRVPIEAIEFIGKDNVRDFLATFQKAPNGYVELYYMSGTGEAGESVYQRYGLEKKLLPEELKNPEERTRKNTLTLFPVLKGEKLDQASIVSRIGNMKPRNTILSPIGLQNDSAGLIRSTVLGLKIMEIARKGEKIDKDEVQIRVLEDLKMICKIDGMRGLTADDIINLATSDDINKIMEALKKLIRLLPIMPIDADELRQIYEHAKQVLIAA